MKRIKQFSASLILLAVYIISVGYLAMVVPADASIPIHWNARGEIDAYTSKGGAVLFALGLNIGLFLLMFFVAAILPPLQTASTPVRESVAQDDLHAVGLLLTSESVYAGASSDPD